MKTVKLLFALLFTATFGVAQEINDSSPERVPENLQIDSPLYLIGQIAATNQASADASMNERGFRIKETAGNTFVNVEIVYRNNYNLEEITDEIDINYLESLGFKVETHWKNRASVWLKSTELIPMASKLSSDYFVFSVYKIIPDNEGPEAINSDSYSSRGGNGIRVAVIDGSFGSLTGAVNGSHAPTPAFMWRYGSEVSTVAGMSSGDVHGTACLETVFDHAPNADYEIYAVGNVTEVGQAVNLCIDHGVDIISMSLSYYNQGWGDNTGAACIAANNAANNGILYFTSAGNRANTHWEGNFSDPDADNWHNWSGGDEQNNRTVGVNRYIRATLSWNPVANSDYNVYIYRASDDAILASGTNSGTTFEDIWWENTSGSSVNVYIAVRRVGTASPQFELFSHDNSTDYEYAVAAGSNTSPSNSTNGQVISVGAVPRASYASAPGTANIIADYSSRGPTNSGNLAPKISSPTSTTTFVYGGAFGGTSCATPNAAGAAAAFWSAHSYLDNVGVRQILFEKAASYKDWGTAGADNIYGHGGIALYDYFANTRYLYRAGGNVLGFTSRPFYNMTQAQVSTPNFGRVVIIGGSRFPENGVYGATGTGANKRITYYSLIKTAYIGD